MFAAKYPAGMELGIVAVTMMMPIDLSINARVSISVDLDAGVGITVPFTAMAIAAIPTAVTAISGRALEPTSRHGIKICSLRSAVGARNATVRKAKLIQGPSNVNGGLVVGRKEQHRTNHGSFESVTAPDRPFSRRSGGKRVIRH